MSDLAELVFVKFGGSLITVKNSRYKPRIEVIRRLAGEVTRALQERPNLRLLLGHGSGSFGHQAAARHGTRQGVRNEDQWRGFTEVAAAAAKLNRIVVDAMLEAGVPVMSVQPSASALCRAGELVELETRSVDEALAHGLVPLVYGDVSLDEEWGGTIVSTEALFIYLARTLAPARILLVGAAPGVLDGAGRPIDVITPENFPRVCDLVGESRATDVTGGMADKVRRMLDLVSQQPGTTAHILTGQKKGLVYQALTGSLLSGTRITAG